MSSKYRAIIYRKYLQPKKENAYKPSIVIMTSSGSKKKFKVIASIKDNFIYRSRKLRVFKRRSHAEAYAKELEMRYLLTGEIISGNQ